MDHPSGLRLTLLADGRVIGQDESLALRLEIKNVSPREVAVSNQPRETQELFAITSDHSARREGLCPGRPYPAVYSPPKILQPGETMQRSAAVPFAPDADAEARRGCRLAPGHYEIQAWVNVCSAGAPNANGWRDCEDEPVSAYATPLSLRIIA